MLLRAFALLLMTRMGAGAHLDSVLTYYHNKFAFHSYENPTSLLLGASAASLILLMSGGVLLHRTRREARKTAFSEISNNLKRFLATGQWKPISTHNVYLFGLISCLALAAILGTLSVSDEQQPPKELSSVIKTAEVSISKPKVLLEPDDPIYHVITGLKTLEIPPEDVVDQSDKQPELNEPEPGRSFSAPEDLVRELIVCIAGRYPLLMVAFLLFAPTFVLSTLSHNQKCKC